MEKVFVQLENCYGIKKFEQTFDFSQKRGYLIYASNGSMKTSFAKTLKAISNGINPTEEIFNRPTVCRILKDNIIPITNEEIFVMDSYDAEFESNKLNTLLANSILKNKYEQIHNDIDLIKLDLIKDLKAISGCKEDVESELSRVFDAENNMFLEVLENLQSDIVKEDIDFGFELSDLKYATLFHTKSIEFIQKGNTPELIAEYSALYNNLLQQSTFFKKGMFTHNNAIEIADNLHKNGFFGANHTIILNGKNESIKSQEELNMVVNAEKEKILTDVELKKRFEKIDAALVKNTELREFRKIIENHPEIIPELHDINSFKCKFWILSLRERREKYLYLLQVYKAGKTEIFKIVQQAKEERTEWERVVSIFTKRFTVPFQIKVTNQEDVILKTNAPSITFTYTDSENSQQVEKKKLLGVLSTGERRALYLLQIIFEIEARIKENKPVLLIVDDIADSFDYKNKYAIIEYLKEIVDNGLFRVIILTHNFDFYRTVGNRFIGRSNCYMVSKYDDRIELSSGGYLKDVFNNWKSRVNTDERILIASIPFVRNIIEYLEGQSAVNYSKLTSLLHLKSDTREIQLSELDVIFSEVWKTTPATNRPQKSVFNTIIQEAEKIVATPSPTVNLENKLVLSMAIRLVAEEFMIDRITYKTGDDTRIKEITGNQTGKLFDLYKEFNSDDPAMIQLLAQVNLMTPENIHINSFMYEPILDMSETHLINLFSTLKEQTEQVLT
jgi:ABC-type cobalamin/Fe3+-siderophores transport system ATPase subunit